MRWFEDIFDHVVSHLPLAESEKSQSRHKLQVTIDAYTLDEISHHQRNILFILFTRDIEKLNWISSYTFKHVDTYLQPLNIS